ncbi:MAG TPA: uroporphyrinogen decarboxylase [Thermomicrobiales bacterium]|nr:uroporphyrinogen decarboxylase [Thermomicrobiales bacterium]
MTTMTTPPAAAPAMTGRARFLAALRRQPVDATPVWFMRQAGRSLPEYRALRERHDFMTLATTPDLAAAATLLPVDRLGVDAAVLFADIMLPLTGMGARFEIRPSAGPVIPEPIRTDADVARLRVPDLDASTPYVFETLRLLRRELGDRTALLGFAGAPFTLACYLIEGKASREFPRAKALMHGRPDLWHRLMAILTETTIGYLNGQIAAGADTVQLFDSWLGLLGPDAYERHVLPYTRRIFAALPPETPAIHFSTGTTALLDQIAASGCAAVSVDWRLPLDAAWARIGPDLAIQGNLDPALLLADWPTVRQGALDVLRRAGGRPGHVFNLGHGVLPDTDPDRLARLVELVHAHDGDGA